MDFNMKWVSGFEGVYAVSAEGVVYSCHNGKWRRIKGRPMVGGYRKVKLRHGDRIRDVFIHRLILEEFVGDCPEGCEARHLNGVPDDNRLANLRWGTPSENAEDRRRHGTLQSGESHSSAKLSREQVCEIRRRAEGGESHTSIARDFPVSRRSVSYIVRGEKWMD